MSPASSQRPLYALWDESIILNTIRYLGSFVGLFSNFFLIFLVFYSKTLRKSQYTWYMMLLTFADILIAFGHFIRTTYIINASSKGILLYSRLICVWINTPMGMGFTATRIAVLAIAADRCYMVINPLNYKWKANAKLILIVFTIQIISIAADTFTKVYGGDNETPITMCSMGAASAPMSSWFGQFYSNSCLALLFLIYIPFLILYRKRNSSQDTTSTSNHWRRQLEVTVTTIWILFLYGFLWGGSFGALFYANFTDNPKLVSGYITYIFGFLSAMCSSASFFVYLIKNKEVLAETKIILNKLKVFIFCLPKNNIVNIKSNNNSTNKISIIKPFNSIVINKA